MVRTEEKSKGKQEGGRRFRLLLACQDEVHEAWIEAGCLSDRGEQYKVKLSLPALVYSFQCLNLNFQFLQL